MSFKDIEIKDSYRTNDCPDLGIYFISRMLEQTVIYKRAVGFFSSSALIKLSKGLSYLTQNDNAHIYLVVSPILYKEDIEAIKQGYQNRDKIIESALLREFKETKDKFECERLNYLCHLIENGILDIKFAIKQNQTSNDELGMFHEKIGLFIDNDDNTIAFTGSLNESDNSYSKNFESIQVFKSWEEQKRVSIISDDFDKLWENETSTLEVCDLPTAVKDQLFKYRKSNYEANIDEYEKKEKAEFTIKDNLPSYKCKFDLYPYQKQAINNWASQSYKGLFDMGTGTGKTVTALTASVKLLERVMKKGGKLATIIVCPYKHLVEQWTEEKDNFNIEFIVGYSSNKYKNYQSVLAQRIQDYNDGIIPYFYFITTNASYRTPKVQELLKQIKGKVLFIADEVHNFGAEGLRNVLNTNYNYRIGLSATIDRHRDEEGTEAIYNYFNKPVIHYGLKEAIDNNVLTRYYYYPIITYLDEEEQEKYIELTDKIKKNSYPYGDSVKLTKVGEIYALKRARLIAATKDKLIKLKEVIEPFKNEHNLLIYCGTGKICSENGDEERQIDDVCKMLGIQLNIKTARYTSRETIEQRQSITNGYKTGNLQAIVAIKCLDEGVNIPSIKKAFILASSTNPREYIQRRGRVLRKFDGKDYSYIYDFITLPIPLDKIKDYNETYIESFNNLAKKEIERMTEFSSLAENGNESDQLINEINDKFNLLKFKKIDNFEKIYWEDEDDEQ
jgi:superfamily II DNA or RNA helicase